MQFWKISAIAAVNNKASFLSKNTNIIHLNMIERALNIQQKKSATNGQPQQILTRKTRGQILDEHEKRGGR